MPQGRKSEKGEKVKDNEVVNLNAREIIEWCNERKRHLGLSNQALSERSGVPQGTIDRILAGKYNEFRYSSIQPIVSTLISLKPNSVDTAADEGQYYSDTIDGYKLILQNKNKELEDLKSANERLLLELDFLKSENEQKQIILDRYHEHIVWLKELVDKVR